ncbi:hypothetical protein BJP36_37745 [Moorena producens JHB]|uniref:Uncharacterized protein n=1 Tax=Moorena producens (strain JHB) TaxID=1454205 RepID=A0A9Q9SUE3_MOOP1|nr:MULTISPECIES: hypothetical protein [Moorena]NEQ10357.1 hypothetical protein [Moorena sp. SIO4E2]WAN69839.1 hypothetical protein BJP36_37745 [Moorena producens JHB]
MSTETNAIDLGQKATLREWSRYASHAKLPRLCDRISRSHLYAIDLGQKATLREWSRYAIAFPIPHFLTIPILTQSLIVDTTPLDWLPTLSTLTTLSSLLPFFSIS